MFNKSDIDIEFDDEYKRQYIYWTPSLTIIESGITKKEALESLKKTAYLLIDSLLDSKYEELLNDVKW